MCELGFPGHTARAEESSASCAARCIYFTLQRTTYTEFATSMAFVSL